MPLVTRNRLYSGSSNSHFLSSYYLASSVCVTYNFIIFRNDLVITEGSRIKIFEDIDGRSILRLNPATEFDLGIYKVVARNKFGQTIARTR